MSPIEARRGPGLGSLLFGGALVTYALALPLGLERVAAADLVARGLALEGGSGTLTAGRDGPLGPLLVRAFAYLPIGDPAARANLACAVIGALALVLVGLLISEALRDLRPPMQARWGPRDVAHEPAAVIAGAAVAGLSFGLFEAVTTAGPAAATLAVVAGGWLLALRVARAPADATAGGGLALLGGLATAVHPVAPLLLWPLGFLLWLWALRRDERWPLVAPLLFVAGLGIWLYAAARGGAADLGQLYEQLLSPGTRSPFDRAVPSSVIAVFVEVSEQVGAVGVLIGLVGLGALLVRAPFAFCVALVSLVVAGMAAGAGDSPRDRIGAAFPVVLLATALPVGAGAAFLSGKMGMARLPAVVVLALIAVVSPLLDRGPGRWFRDTRLPARLLERGLDGAALRARVNPGTPEMSGVFRYARALGLRPDLSFGDGNHADEVNRDYGKMPRSP